MKPSIHSEFDSAAVQLDVRDERLFALINRNAKLVRLATGFDFLEGPIWDRTDDSIIFSDIMGNSIYRWSEGNGVEQLRRNSYMANGNTFDAQGRMLTCEHATSRVSRSRLGDETYEVLATHYGGKQLNSPNDIVVRSDGSVYFTDPTSGRSAGYGVPREPELDFAGVYRLDPESGELTLLVQDFSKPNGLCFSIDESLLYVNDTDRQHIRVFEVTAEGRLDNGRLFADLTGKWPGVADGMKIDSAGHIYACGPGGIQIFDRTGVCLGVILMPEKTANFVFSESDQRYLTITASTSLYRLPVNL